MTRDMWLKRFTLSCAVLLWPGTELCAQSELQYPTSAEIRPVTMEPSRAELLLKLLRLSSRADFKEREDVRKELCPALVRRPDPAQLAIKAALAVNEASIHGEIEFRKGDRPGIDTPGDTFSVFLRMDESGVLIKTSRPRFNSEAAGLSVPFPTDHTRPMWIEGKEGTNFLVLLPTVRECSTRAIVICSRTYQPAKGLVQSRYAPVAARYFIKTKGDGLFAPPSGTKGKIVASVLGSAGVPLPSPWLKENVSSATPTVTLKHQTAESPPPLFSPISLPAAATVESRLDFGSESADQRVSWARASFEVSEFQLAEQITARVRAAELKVEPGTCYLISTWGETQF